MVSKPAGEMETSQGQPVVRKRVRQRWPPQEQRGRERDARPFQVSERRRRHRRRCWKNRRAHTGAREPVRGAKPTPAAGEMRFRFRSSPARQRRRIQNQKPTAAVHVRHSVVGSVSAVHNLPYFCDLPYYVLHITIIIIYYAKRKLQTEI